MPSRHHSYKLCEDLATNWAKMKSMGQFHTATLKLTAWYLAILMTVSLAFSVVIYSISAHELDRPLSHGGFSPIFEENEEIRLAREERALEGKQSLIINLVILNVVTLALGAGASYLFARRTFQPIEEAMEAQSRFVSDASHELRTPLAAMKIENEIMLRGSANKSELASTLKSNLEEVDRLQALTDRLLAISSDAPVVRVKSDVREIVQTALQRLNGAADNKKITIDTSGTLPSHVLADLESAGDIVAILIDNAIKYSPAGSTVTVASDQRGRHVALSVSDEGDGISDEDMPHIFDRFYRVDQSRSKQNVEGHGLGLALARRLAERNQARLSAENNADKGAKFTLELEHTQ